MTHSFDPHPQWRRNFEFAAAYTSKTLDYELDPTIAAKINSTVEFKLDPTIEKFKICEKFIKS